MKKLTLLLFLAIGIISCGNETTTKNVEKENQETTEVSEEVQEETPTISKSVNSEDFALKGKKIMKGTFMELSKNLKAKMNEEGPVGAIDFCNKNAKEIMAKMSKEFNAEIKRTSFKLRNSDDEANYIESEILHEYEKMMRQGMDINPIVREKDGVVNFYAPIKIKKVCLNCHGMKGSDIHDDTYAKISELYPEDKAIGYKEGDLRGIWSIKYNK